MIERSIDIVETPEGLALEFDPHVGVRFTPFIIQTISIEGLWNRIRLADELQTTIQNSCDNKDMCGAVASFTVSGPGFFCRRANCPLNEPPTDDNEPLVPAPQPPTLEAEADLPDWIQDAYRAKEEGWGPVILNPRKTTD